MADARADDTYTKVRDMPSARSSHRCTTLPDGRVFICGGFNSGSLGGRLSDTHIYTPLDDTYTKVRDMPSARSSHGCTALPDGRVFICGGSSGHSLSDAHIYNPLDDTYTKVRDMPSARRGHGCTALPDGRVFICGGHNGDRLSDAHIYNPLDDTYTKVRDAPGARYGDGCTTLPDGRVFIGGGFGANRRVLSDAHIYTPLGGPVPHVIAGTLPPAPSPQGSFQAKAATLEAWLTEAESVLLSAQMQLQEEEKELHQQCDASVADAHAAYERGVRQAEQKRVRAVQRATQARDRSLGELHSATTTREIEATIQTIRVEARENRQMASIIAGQSLPPAAAPTRNECVVCTDNEASFVIGPCGHLCVCEGCKDALLARGSDCPNCRGKIETTFKVFF